MVVGKVGLLLSLGETLLDLLGSKAVAAVADLVAMSSRGR
jgi:hypothetical protein